MGAGFFGLDHRQGGIPVLAPGADWPPVKGEYSLYIHIPFCAGACDYCDFFSVPVTSNGGDGPLDSFVDALLADIADQLELYAVETVPTAYIGGGTPSALGARRMERLLAGLAPLPAFSPAEFTVEANPESADEDFLKACLGGGVNRISLGVQSFYEPSRRAVRRVGAAGLLEKRLALLARYYPGAFSADLIAGLPFQTESVLLSDIERLLAFGPAHVSLYSLTVEPETPLGNSVEQRGRAARSLPDGDEADAIWLAGRDALERAGYAQYEVSNFSPPGGQCAHNLRYWRMAGWLGAGPAASGTIIDEAAGTGRRYTYPADIAAYAAAPRPAIRAAQVEELDRAALMRESLLMGFRCREGPDTALFRRRFSRGIGECIPQTIARWRERGFFTAGADGPAENLSPSREGLLFVDSFLRDAFREMEDTCNSPG
jgi:oxygen-independent coproporphyrinogen-3 oxidase